MPTRPVLPTSTENIFISHLSAVGVFKHVLIHAFIPVKLKKIAIVWISFDLAANKGNFLLIAINLLYAETTWPAALPCARHFIDK